MKQIETWQKPRTSRAYLHPVHSGRLITIYPDMKITDLDLQPIMRHYNQPGYGVHLVFGSEPGDIDMENTVWEKPHGGRPIYVLRNTDPENGCEVRMEAFSAEGRIPVTHCRLTVKNIQNINVSGTFGFLPRYNKVDHYLTGLHDTGYEPYNPNIRQWYLSWQNGFAPDAEGSPDASSMSRYGHIRVTKYSGCECRWISRGEQINRFKAHDYYRFDYTLNPGEEAYACFAMCRDAMEEIPSYDEAYERAVKYWDDIQSKVKVIPQCSAYEDMYRHQISVSLQMLQKYDGDDHVCTRQGDVGRYLWVWEAVHYLSFLDRAGLGEYCTDAYRMWYDNWQLTEGRERGKLANPFVNWDNTNGSALGGTSYHLLEADDRELFEEFRPRMNLALEYIVMRRSPENLRDGDVPGLFSSGKASDWGEVGQHWTYTDAVNVFGLKYMAECYEHFGAEEADYVRGIYEDYRSCVEGVMNRLAEEHKGERSFNAPHILGVPFEESYNHCFYTDGEPYLISLGFLDPHSEMFTQMETWYRDAGFLDDEHGLAGIMTNDDCGSPGLYGHVYYTCVPELNWIMAYRARGEEKLAQAYMNGILNYNITSEYITSERYCSVDPWFTPWQPNGSGAGRIGHMLLYWFGEKRLR